ncbi:hypothetical protein F5Y18DRAFT_42650 [Xylariaceae sp. FL1019]|nr:hypothetical protein F5Y18DRAFT_42650 [Xylariaceae sp. FL1019]
MGRPPAYVFVVRHGARLDAADKQWHLTSPTPYDPPLTYGGWLQSRTVGARIASILQTEAHEPHDDAIPSSSPPRKRRFRVILHSSPFLRCVQTSIAIASGLASDPDRPSHKSVLRLDAFLGEWLSPEYFEHITPPPKSAFMLATAKAELLRRESHHESHFHTRVHSAAGSQLWNAPPGRDGHLVAYATLGSANLSSLDTLTDLGHNLPKIGPSPSRIPKKTPTYVAPRPPYAHSTSEPIPKGYVAHARDACASTDYQWDSSRENMGWGDGGHLPEEWAFMHQRFRRGLRRMIDWYATTENPGEMVTKTANAVEIADRGCIIGEGGDGEIEDVVVLVSHGAGCNALVGAITHHPVLADVAMSSLTMAKRRPEFDYRNSSFARVKSAASLNAVSTKPRASMPDMYELKLFANTEHLRSAPTPATIGRSASLAGANSRSRPETARYPSALKEINFGATERGGPQVGSRSNSACASLGDNRRPIRDMALAFRPSSSASNEGGITVGSGVSGFAAATTTRSGSFGLWSPKPKDEDEAEKESNMPMLLDFSNEKPIEPPAADLGIKVETGPAADDDSTSAQKYANENHENHADEEHDQFDEDSVPHLWAGTGNGGLWGAPRPPDEAERLRDFSASKRRWTVNER